MNLSAIVARPLGAALLLAVVGNANASPQVLYHNTFDARSDIGSEWNKRNHTDGPLGGFLGRFTDELAILNIEIPTDPGPEPPIEPPVVPIDTLPTIGELGNARSTDPVWVYSIIFDLNLLDSWDGDSEEHGKDRFFVRINNQTVFSEYLTNHSGGVENFRAADVGPYNIGWNHWNDSVFKGIRIDFLVADDVTDLEFKFRGTADQGLEDESWGLDNVQLIRQRVSVPAPATALAFAGLGVTALRRRRS
ncbi:MAG: hypothetical protein RIB32_01795 [Phycisphaerales bacterium]